MKTVLITGAGIGIGRATAKMFGTHGWRVIVTDVLEDEGAVVAAEINASGGTAEFHTLDVTSTAAAEAVLASVHASHGPLAALVCNAGIAHKVPLEELTDEKWDHTFEIDLKGMIRVIRPVVAQMKLVGGWRNCLPVFYHGCCLWLGSTCALLCCQIWRHRACAGPWRRTSAQQYTRQRCGTRLH